MIPPQWDAALCDGTIPMGDDEAIGSARELARREGSSPGSRPVQTWRRR